VRTDSRGTILDVNAPATRLLNLSRQAVIGKALSLFIAKDRDTFVERLTEFTTGHRVDEWPLQIRPREKQRVWVTATVHVSAARDDDAALHWLLKGDAI
jgi:PAS domain-containing protein